MTEILVFSCFYCYFIGCIQLRIVWIQCFTYFNPTVVNSIRHIFCFMFVKGSYTILSVFYIFFVLLLFPFFVAFWFWKCFHSRWLSHIFVFYCSILVLSSFYIFLSSVIIVLFLYWYSLFCKVVGQEDKYKSSFHNHIGNCL